MGCLNVKFVNLKIKKIRNDKDKKNKPPLAQNTDDEDESVNYNVKIFLVSNDTFVS